MSSPRVRKVADRIQVIVAEMLERRVKDPRLGFVTVTDVRVTGDTQNATIFYTVLGEGDDLASSAAALESAKGILRSEVGRQLGMRHVPTLEFVHDALPDNARHLDDLLAKARESDARVAAAAAGATYAGDADPYRKPHEPDDDLAPEADREGVPDGAPDSVADRVAGRLPDGLADGTADERRRETGA